MESGRRAIVAFVVAGLLACAATAEAKVTRYLTGSAADVNPPLFGPAHDFGGGGLDVDAALQWLIDAVRGCTSCPTKIDVVILRSTGANGYNPYIFHMNGVDSVETLVITTPGDSNRANVVATVQKAELVFFAGGDQCDYVTNFKGTLVESAVESVYARGGGVGGTSAGFAIQGEYSYDACTGSVTSGQALGNPYHPNIHFTYGFFGWANMERTITDQHFVARDRMGRTMAFLARQIEDGITSVAWALAVDEKTSVVVDEAGMATVMGDGPAYLVLADHPPEQCDPQVALTYSDFKIWRFLPGDTFDLANRPTTGYYVISVTGGLMSGDPY